MKIDTDFVKKSFTGGEAVEAFKQAVTGIGLWKSEEKLFTKYFGKDDRILDIGCGAGRTTVGMYNLGYRRIEGLDLSADMIRNARQIAASLGLDIPYHEGNALSLLFPENEFDGAIFSFNGFMQIPGRRYRDRAMSEIARVLKPGAHYVFTAHPDRDSADDYREFWAEEKARWDQGKQDPRLIDFGDRILSEESGGRQIFLHFATDAELLDTVVQAGLEHVGHFPRADVSEESDKVKDFSFETVFWIARKPSF